MAVLGSGRLVIVKRDGSEGSSYWLNIGSLTLGRSKDCDIVLPSKDLPPKQCVITVYPSEARIKNLANNTSTIINSNPVAFKILQHCDLISLGNAKFRWEYTNKIVTPNTLKKSTKKLSTTVKRTRVSVTRRKSEPPLKKHLISLETKGRNSIGVLSKPQSRQVAIVKPQTRCLQTVLHTSIQNYQSTSKMEGKGFENKSKLPSSNKKKKVDKVEKFDSPVILDKNKQAALFLLTKKRSISSPVQVIPLQNTPKSKITRNSIRSCSANKVCHTSLRDVSKCSNISKTPKVNDLARKLLISESKKRLTMASTSKIPIHTPNLKNKINNEFKNNTSVPINSLNKKKDRKSSSLRKENHLRATPSLKINKTRRSLALQTPILSKTKTSPIRKSKTASPANNLQNDASPFLSFLSSLTNALNIMNNSDMEVVRKTPEFQAISDKIKSVEKLEESMSVESPSPQILEIGKISRSSKRTPSNVILNSPIISPKHSSPELFDSTLNCIDINTPNLSQIFDIKSSTPMEITNNQKNTPMKHSRQSRRSLYTSNNKNSGGFKAKSKTEPKNKFKVKIDFNSLVSKINLSKENLSDSSNITNIASQVENELNVTPKSSLKPPPEILKEKHSTAKKPVSKRSIIDHLTRSPEVAKELFKSPVKRILSESMRHYNSCSFDENDSSNMNTTFENNSFELLTRSKSISNNISNVNSSQNDQKTKKSSLRHISNSRGTKRLLQTPIKNKNDSSNVRGVKQLFKPNSPVNNLSNLGNIKSLFRLTKTQSPKNDLMNISGIGNIFREKNTQKSLNNDLNNVTGVKELFRSTRSQRSPKNDLTDVDGVKELFRTTRSQKSPKNDLTSVDGVKELFRTTRSQKSPKNDLKNVDDIKELFRTTRFQKSLANSINIPKIENVFNETEPENSGKTKEINFDTAKELCRSTRSQKSPQNNLTNVSGVKKLCKNKKSQNSPKNDLTNIQGVKELFDTFKLQNSPRNDLTEVDGVKELFRMNRSHNYQNNLANVSGAEDVNCEIKYPKPTIDFSNFDDMKEMSSNPQKDVELNLNCVHAMFNNLQNFLHERGYKCSENTKNDQKTSNIKNVSNNNLKGVKKNSRKSRNSLNSFEAKSPLKINSDEKCTLSSSVLENVGLIPNNFFKLKLESNSTVNNRSRRQATIDKTSFSLELSKVNMSTKKDSKATTDNSVLSHSTPFFDSKPNINEFHEVSPLCSDSKHISPMLTKTRKRIKIEKNEDKIQPKKTRLKVKLESTIKEENPDSDVTEENRRCTRSAVRNIKNENMEILINENIKFESNAVTNINKASTRKNNGTKKKVTFDLTEDKGIDRLTTKKNSRSLRSGVHKKVESPTSKKGTNKPATTIKTTKNTVVKKKNITSETKPPKSVEGNDKKEQTSKTKSSVKSKVNTSKLTDSKNKIPAKSKGKISPKKEKQTTTRTKNKDTVKSKVKKTTKKTESKK